MKKNWNWNIVIVKKIVKKIILITAILAVIALSWILTCGIIKLITMCFGIAFKWNIATGIWLVMILLKAAIKYL